MQNFFSRALSAALLMGACITNAAVPTVQEASIALRQTAAIHTQITGFNGPSRLHIVQALGLNERAESVSRTGNADETDTTLMLLGALAVMGVMVRRRWNSRD